ncbi:MAG: hypothetical protein LC722_02965, partial [Actinobacteria bacterium]|nr:hypothetical protein [Actinomycetota bacterium]
TRFVDDASRGGLAVLVDTALSRLEVGWRLLVRVPFAWILVVGIGALIAILRRPPALLRAGLDRRPEWHAALVALVGASIVAYVGNDTGAAAAGFGFGLAAAGMLYIAFAAAESRPAAEEAAAAAPVA